MALSFFIQTKLSYILPPLRPPPPYPSRLCRLFLNLLLLPLRSKCITITYVLTETRIYDLFKVYQFLTTYIFHCSPAESCSPGPTQACSGSSFQLSLFQALHCSELRRTLWKRILLICLISDLLHFLEVA